MAEHNTILEKGIIVDAVKPIFDGVDNELKEKFEKCEFKPGWITEVSYQSAIDYMNEDDKNVIVIRNFSEEEKDYMIDGGKDSLLDLELEENEDFKMYEFYK